MADELFAQIAARVDSEDTTDQAVFLGAQQDPDTLASAVRLADRAGVPVSFAADPKLKPGLEQKVRQSSLQEQLQGMAPDARAWLTRDPVRLGMAQDDLKPLSVITNGFEEAKRVERMRIEEENKRRGGFLSNLIAPANRGFWIGLVGRPVASVSEIMSAATGSLEALIRPDSRDIEQRLKDAGRQWTAERDTDTLGGTIAAGVNQAERFISKGTKETPSVRLVNPRTGEKFTNADALKDPWLYVNVISENAPQMAAQTIMGVRAFNAARASGASVEASAKAAARVGATMEASQIFGEEFEKAREKGLGIAHAGTVALAITVPSTVVSQGIPGTRFEGGLEGVFFQKMAETAETMTGPKGRALRSLFGMAKEGAEEGIQENISIAGELTYDPTAADAWAERNIMAVIGGGTLGAGQGSLIGPRTFQHPGAGPTDTQAFLKNLSNAAKESKLNQRNPAMFAEAVQEQAPEGMKDVLVQADRFFQAVEDSGQDPEEVAQRLKIPNLQEALSAGSDVIIPVGEYASQIAPTALHDKLSEDVRFGYGETSQREATEGPQMAPGEAESVGESAALVQAQADLEALPAPAIERFRETTKQALMAGSVPESEAGALADLRASAVRVFLENGDITEDQALSLWPLTVSAYTPGESPNQPITDTVLDRLRALGDSVREYFQNDRQKRARMKNYRALSPSGQGAELNRRAAEVQAEEAAFQEFDQSVKELQAGEVYGDKRGFIQFGEGGKTHIGLLANRNLSTLLHESSHMFLEMLGDVAEMPTASERTRALWADTLQALKVDSREQLGTDQHEAFARWGERYFMEGKAPSERLRPLMQRFRSWMVLVYQTLEKLGVRMNNDARSLFDRLLATDREMLSARQRNTPRIFTTPEDMGVSRSEFEAYTKIAGDEITEANEAADAAMLADLQRQKSEAWQSERAAVLEEVAGAIDRRQDMQALAKLHNPESTIKLNRASIESAYGSDTARALPTVKEGGMDAEAAAVLLGFGSGDALVKALQDAPKRDELVETLTDELMLARYGDPRLDGTVADEVTKALENDKKAERLSMELRALGRLKAMVDRVSRARDREARTQEREADAGIPSIQAVREQARGLIQDMRLRHMEPNKYRLNGERYSREAYELKGKKDYAGAAQSKTRELLNHFMYLEAVKARQAGEEAYAFVRRYSKRSVRERIAKAGGDKGQQVFLDQVDNLLERYEFVRVPNYELEARQSLVDFAIEKAAQGEMAVIDPVLYNGQPKNFRDLTPIEMRALVDALKSIETMARRNLEFISNGKRVTFEQAKTELLATARKNMKEKPQPLDPKTRSLVDKAVSAAKSANTAIIKMEQVIDELDGGDINGPFRRYIFEPMCQAQFKEFDLNQRITGALAEAMETMPPQVRRSLADHVEVPNVGTVTRGFLFSVALNTGNESNQTKMLEGMGWNTPEKLEGVSAALGRLNREEWQAVQRFWDILDSLWPEIEALELRMTGIAPKRVDVRPFTVNFDDGSQLLMRGGYYPVVYDPEKSGAGARQADVEIMTSEGGWNGPITSKGHTKERKRFSAPLLLDFESVMTRHISRVVKDLTHREPAITAARLIMDQDVRDTLVETVGPEYEKMLLPWLKGTVNDVDSVTSPELSMWRKTILATRTNLVLGTLAFRASSVVVQATDFGRLMTGQHRVGPGYLAEALGTFARHPQDTLRTVREKSGEMRGRAENLDRDLRAMFRRVQGKDGAIATAQQWGMKGLAVADMIVSVTGWLASYNQAISKGSSESEARAMADRTVRFKLMTGAPKDLTALQRSGDLGLKMATMYMGDLVSTYGIINQSVRSIANSKKILDSSFAIVMAGMIIPILGQVIKSGLKGDLPEDEEEWKRYLAKKAAFSLPSSVPLVRDVAQAMDSGRDAQFTPLAVGINRLAVRPGRALMKAAEGDDVDWGDFTLNMLESVGTFAGAPGGQFGTTAGYLYDVYTGEEDPDSAGEFVQKALFGR